VTGQHALKKKRETTMGKLEDVVKGEIVRLAKKQVRGAIAPLRKEVRKLKRIVSQLSKATAKLEKTTAQQAQLTQENLRASEEEVRVARISARVVKNLRKKLGISQEKLAALAGVTPGAVAAWEQGRARPRGANKSAVIALRKLGRRDVKRLLAAREAPAKAKKARKKTNA
jgi:DNA-binding transcriptional regulator YiaG